MARYSDINKAEQLMAAKTKLDAWRKLDAAAKSTAYKASRLGLRINVGWSWGFIKPFGDNSSFFWEARLLSLPTTAPKADVEENNNTLVTNVRSAVVSSGCALEERPIGAGLSVRKAKKIAFSRVICTAFKTQTKNATSRTTGRPYTLVESDTVSCAFGQGVSPNNVEQSAQSAIRSALKTSMSSARVSFKPQGFVG